VMVDASPHFGHSEVDLALVDYFSPVPDDLFDAYREVAQIDSGFLARRELWRVFAYLAVVTVDGANPFGQRFLMRLTDAVERYE